MSVATRLYSLVKPALGILMALGAFTPMLAQAQQIFTYPETLVYNHETQSGPLTIRAPIAITNSNTEGDRIDAYDIELVPSLANSPFFTFSLDGCPNQTGFLEPGQTFTCDFVVNYQPDPVEASHTGLVTARYRIFTEGTTFDPQAPFQEIILQFQGSSVVAATPVDTDGDGVPDASDQCPNTPAGAGVDADGCADSQKDSDGDGVNDDADQCPNTPAGSTVDVDGCADSQKDSDGDGVNDDVDQCPNTPAGETVDADGCSDAQKTQDADGDGVEDALDQCPNTPAGEAVDADGCADSQKDSDGDGVTDDVDQCPSTPAGEMVDADGCSDSQKTQDADGDGVEDAVDVCPNTPAGEMVDADGCSASQRDSDGDGVKDNVDLCPATPLGEPVDADGCADSQKTTPGDEDGDGVPDSMDECPNTPEGVPVDEDGCPSEEAVRDALRAVAGNSATLTQTADAVSNACANSAISGQLLLDCDALTDASVEGATGVAEALREITPERAVQANAAIQRQNTVRRANIGGRIRELRMGSRGVSVAGLSLGIGDQSVGANQLVAMLEEGLEPAGGASSDEDSMLLANSRWGSFISGEISRSERDAEDGSSGFDLDASAISIGVDYRVTDNFFLGTAVSLTDTENSFLGQKGSVESDGYALTLYGAAYAGSAYFDFSVTTGQDDFDQSRTLDYTLGSGISASQVFSSSYDGDTTAAYFAAGYNFVESDWTVSGQISIDYLKSELDAFTEQASNPNGNGAGWAVRVDGQEQRFSIGTLTGRISRVISMDWGVMTPYVEVDMLREFQNNGSVLTASFVGSENTTSLGVTIRDPDTSYYRARVGTSVVLPNGLLAFVDYGRVFAYDRFDEYSVSGGVRWEF